MATTSTPQMRAILSMSSTVLLAMASSCTCGPSTPVPITMRVINTSSDPLYLDFTQGGLGLTVKRQVGGTLYPFDDLACECDFCSNACLSACTCPGTGDPRVRRLDPGERAQRDWSGVVQVSGTSSCGTGPCLDQANAPLNESFDLELCFSYQRPAGVLFEDGGVGVGELPRLGRTCVDRRFAIQDGVVEISPQRGAACGTSADCAGQGELCFSGACTTGCPPNGFPDPGAVGGLLVPTPDDMGFFTSSPSGSGTRIAGSGVITSALYQGSSLQLSLRRPTTGETGRVTVLLPAGVGVSLVSGAAVAVLVVDSGGDPSSSHRALSIRDGATGALLLAADPVRGTPLLTGSDLAPFTLGSGVAPVGCSVDGCGKLLLFTRTLDAGVAGAAVSPGGQATVVLSSGSYTLLSISDGAYAATSCDVTESRPYVLWRSGGP